ncbi:hypothetical protein BdWA1_003216 [Babesia duncani]|uniref:Uncharacterized protein n=1 Tax=Babesia duncani TaxID=323732 RepID=A0AAD9PIX8_9APIC|nr:hypothetical protein BdWA1_003216 [Babesia duncani]
MPRPMLMLLFNIVAGGGYITGILYGFMTITSVSSCDKCTLVEKILLSPLCSCILTRTFKEKLELAMIYKKEKGEQKRIEFEQRKRTEKLGFLTPNQIAKLKAKFNSRGGPVCRMRLREWIVRLSCGLVLVCCCVDYYHQAIFLGALSIGLLVPSVYKSFNPPGQLKFQGWIKCHCCTVTRFDQIFKEGHRPDYYNERQVYWCWHNDTVAKYYCGDSFGNFFFTCQINPGTNNDFDLITKAMEIYTDTKSLASAPPSKSG